MLQSRYNKNRLQATRSAPEQSKMFFHIWHLHGLWHALRWWYYFKKHNQRLSYVPIRMIFDAVGSLLVASGAVKFQIVATIAVFMMMSVGGTGDVVVEDGGPG